ncbi:BRCA1-A complex subunit BRE [Trichinella spiralis]|uniref:BRISC and BRCA1-A complex member 2 n=1 Tax=Trichinella spiralis TaxID=6334 RepID=A0A0V1AXA5_TRISP|nr:BRCA1-A complex subunit BRE [Trichinella spiralis]
MTRNLESSSDKNTSQETFCYKSYNDSSVRCLVDWLKTPVKHFLDFPFFGCFKANICKIQSGASSFVSQQLKNVPLGDRFRIFINFGDFEFSCYVVFQWSHQLLPPEFYFNEENFIPDVEMIEAYTKWDISNPNCLLDLFLELFMKYQDFHLYNCYSNSIIRLHLNSLELSKYEDILAFLGRGGYLTCIIRIDLEQLFCLPEILTNVNKQMLKTLSHCNNMHTMVESFYLRMLVRAENQWEYREEFIRMLKESNRFLNVTADEEMFYSFSFCATLEEFTFCVQVKLPSDIIQAPIVYKLVPSVLTLPSTSEEVLFEFKFHILDNLTPQGLLDAFLVEVRKSMSSVKQKLDECLQKEKDQAKENEEQLKEENENPAEEDATNVQEEEAKSG